MTDRELIELAARAAGITLVVDPYGHIRNATGAHEALNVFSLPLWNPLRDPGDALRLATALHIELKFQAPDYSFYWTVLARDYADFAAATENGPDTLAATMRAITRAAAEIGRVKT